MIKKFQGQGALVLHASVLRKKMAKKQLANVGIVATFILAEVHFISDCLLLGASLRVSDKFEWRCARDDF